MANDNKGPLVAVVMGSRSDWDTLQHAVAILEELAIPFETRVVSAHRTPDRMFEFAASARAREPTTTVHAPQSPSAQPSFVPVRRSAPIRFFMGRRLWRKESGGSPDGVS